MEKFVNQTRSTLRRHNFFSIFRQFHLNRAIRILVITNGMILTAAAMIGPIYALFVEKIGGDLLDASLAGGAFSIAAGVTIILSGRLSDRVKRPELIIVAGYVIMGIGFLSYNFVQSIWTLLVVQVLIGFGEAIYSPSFDAVYSKHLDRGLSGTEWAAWESMNYFTAAGGAVIGGLVVTFLGFNTLFVIMSALCVASAVYIYRLPQKVL